MKFVTAYSEKKKVALVSTLPSRTKQQFKEECDINNIISRFLKTGVLNFTSKNAPRYGDVTAIEYQDAMLKVAQARTLFAELPAAIRSRFDNEPAQFLAFVQDEKNRDEALAMGLLKSEATRVSAEATPLAPTPTATSTAAPAAA